MTKTHPDLLNFFHRKSHSFAINSSSLLANGATKSFSRFRFLLEGISADEIPVIGLLEPSLMTLVRQLMTTTSHLELFVVRNEMIARGRTPFPPRSVSQQEPEVISL